MSVADTLGLVSGDSHVSEPRDLWSANLPPALRSKALRGIKPGADGYWDLILAGEPYWPGSEPEEERAKINDVAHRYEVMRQEGVVGECIYPTVGLNVWVLSDRELGWASCRVYNEWMASGLARSPRFKCAGVVPTWRVDDAVEEIGWIARSGLGAIMLPGGLRTCVESQVLGADVGRDRRHRATGRDAPGNRPQYVLLPGTGGRGLEPGGHPITRPPYRSAPCCHGRAGQAPSPPFRVRRVQQRMALVDHVRCRLLHRGLPRPGRRRDRSVGQPRAYPSCRATT